MKLLKMYNNGFCRANVCLKIPLCYISSQYSHFQMYQSTFCGLLTDKTAFYTISFFSILTITSFLLEEITKRFARKMTSRKSSEKCDIENSFIVDYLWKDPAIK